MGWWMGVWWGRRWEPWRDGTEGLIKAVMNLLFPRGLSFNQDVNLFAVLGSGQIYTIPSPRKSSSVYSAEGLTNLYNISPTFWQLAHFIPVETGIWA